MLNTRRLNLLHHLLQMLHSHCRWHRLFLNNQLRRHTAFPRDLRQLRDLLPWQFPLRQHLRMKLQLSNLLRSCGAHTHCRRFHERRNGCAARRRRRLHLQSSLCEYLRRRQSRLSRHLHLCDSLRLLEDGRGGGLPLQQCRHLRLGDGSRHLLATGARRTLLHECGGALLRR